MKHDSCQVLVDRSRTGRVRPWAVYKLANTHISLAYDEIDHKKADRLRACALQLMYRKDGDIMRLVHADFCRVRLCPVCQWRRCLKNYSQMSRVLAAIEGQYSYIMLTLTVRNCSGSDLSVTIDRLMTAFNRLVGYKDFQSVAKGWYRGLEVTHNIRDPSDVAYDTYHPHFHLLIAVNPSYFTSRYYLAHDRWVALWRRALRVGYDPVVDVRRVTGTNANAIAEVAKYAVKPQEIIVYDDWYLTVDTVRTLDTALANRRLIAYGGILKDMHHKLNFDDADDGDLIDIGINDVASADDADEITYFWHTGYSQYLRS